MYEIDGMSVEYFLTNLLINTGFEPKDLTADVIADILWKFPLIIIEEKGSYVSSIRTFIEFSSTEKHVKFFGNVKEGHLIKLSTGDSEDILNDVSLGRKEFLNVITHNRRKPDVILNISWVARNYVLLADKKESEEQKIYKNLLENLLIVGFLTFGGIGLDRFGKSGNFYSKTFVLVGLEES